MLIIASLKQLFLESILFQFDSSWTGGRLLSDWSPILVCVSRDSCLGVSRKRILCKPTPHCCFLCKVQRDALVDKAWRSIVLPNLPNALWISGSVTSGASSRTWEPIQWAATDREFRPKRLVDRLPSQGTVSLGQMVLSTQQVNLAFSCMDTKAMRFISWEECTSRGMESSKSLLTNSGQMTRVASLRTSLERPLTSSHGYHGSRSAALDMAGLCDYEASDAWKNYDP